MPDYLALLALAIPGGLALVLALLTQRNQRRDNAILAAAVHAKAEKNGLVAADAADVERIEKLEGRIERLETEREQLRLDRLTEDRAREEERRTRQKESDVREKEWHIERDDLRAQLKGALEEIETLKQLLAREEFQALLVAKIPEPVPTPKEEA